jgi:O-antigen/teichoic acid export membrane protein
VTSGNSASRTSFVRNVLWGWTGVVVNLLIGIILSPIIIKKLGVEQYGIWVLLFALVDYMRVLDFGFRSAVVHGCARFRAREDWEGVNRTVSTALAYFAIVGTACVLATLALRGLIVGSIDIGSTPESSARTLIVLIAMTVTIRLASSPLTAALEAFQRFDIVNRAYIGALLFRSTASLAILFAGYGLLEMAIVVVVAQIGESLFTFFRVRRIVPAFKLMSERLGRDTFLSLFHYGKYTAIIAAANLISINAPTTALGYLRTAAEVGYFALPFRLLMYAAEGLAKVSDVTLSVTAALDETGDRSKVWRLAVLTNRHCFALFMPLAIFLSLYGTPLLRLWVNPEVAAHSGPLFPILALAFLFAISGQYNAGGVLFGQGRHRPYAYAMVVEAAATVILLVALVPAFGVVAAAWVVTSALLFGRGVLLAVMLCRQNGFALGRYLAAVYGRGLAAGAVVLPLALILRATTWPGNDWIELIAAGSTIAATYFAVAFFAVLEPEQREIVLRRVAAAV